MKNILNRRIYGWLAAVGVLFATSCVKDETTDGYGSGNEVTVSYTIAPEDFKVGTRAVDYTTRHISDGSQTDVLIYAVYEAEKDDNNNVVIGNLIETYGRGVISEELKDAGFVAGKGQTVLKVDEFPVTIDFRFVRGKTYQLVFWAQNSTCKAYKTLDLKKLEVVYSELNKPSDNGTSTPNNDETRDAFCKSETITADADNLTSNIFLTRPLAQVNVGTAGYDFEVITRGTNSKKYSVSKIQLGDLARYMDVVNDEVLRSTILGDEYNSDDSNPMRPESRSTADFGYARIPSYFNYSDSKFKSIDVSKAQDDEEFLYVDLNHNGSFTEYVSYDQYKANLDAVKDIEDEDEKAKDLAELNYTETFKYLSMCYVLVPAKKEGTHVLDNVTVWLNTEDYDDECQILTVSNVPVQRNWRTNIIGQNLLTDNVEITVYLDQQYSGEFNSDDFGAFSGPLADGVFYDAETDEILLSNTNGLLWFAKMVNGTHDYYVWDKKNLGSGKPDSDVNGTEKGYHNTVFTLNGIADPTIAAQGTDAEKAAEALKTRILTATHAKNKEWPTNNTFRFEGATVKLSNDIDLAGVEWIPIGFDNRTDENTTWNETTDKNAQYSAVFCGTFNGNGHTIRNMANREFSSAVHYYYYAPKVDQNTPAAFEGETSNYHSKNKYERYDNPQWNGVGLFGLIAGNATIENVRLYNVTLKGHHGAGAIAAFVAGTGNVTIKDCYVDGGTIMLTPVYRGDWSQRVAADALGVAVGRTFARALHVGGIAGFIQASNCTITGCDVRNVAIEGYRNVGGLVGTDYTDTGKDNTNKASNIFDNTVSNSYVIANKFQVYDYIANRYDSAAEGVYKTGFGWKIGQDELTNVYVGASGAGKTDAKNSYVNNNQSDVTVSRFAAVQKTKAGGSTSDEGSIGKRVANIDNTKLQYLPMLSSWFADEIVLKSNFYGTPSAYTKTNKVDFTRTVHTTEGDTGEPETYNVPFELPFSTTVNYNETSGKAGIYVESVLLDGSKTSSGHSVITVEDVKGHNDCVAYITTRDFETERFTKAKENDKLRNTTVNEVVFRGNPYAYTGILLAPNQFTGDIKLNNVSVYDVYHTIALEEGSNASTATLSVSGGNLRGYTTPGAGWKAVNFTSTVFGQGAGLGHNKDEYTYVVDKTTDDDGTTFTECWFKAPYFIEIKEGAKVNFKDTKATSQSDWFIELKAKEGCTRIEISDNAGNVVVRYYAGDTLIEEHTTPSGE